MSDTHVFPLSKPEEEWQSELTADEYHVIREKGTEPPGAGEYDKFYPSEGYFVCRACQTPVYSAESKYNSGCGWPAFDKCYVGGIATQLDTSHNMRRIEIMCANCGGHLGHVFHNQKKGRTGERHCVNSHSVRYVKGVPPVGMVEDVVGSG
eukprot:comp13128_c1_seq1/m.8454 comp13128_c1_seq1/g.8454  ORF comp13128_c1_seq1/g.8454 comp13128_c1_seq1/m.8454 type:complete len:151 (-) comp13128_c1_seq1:134-586(-)